MIRYLVLTSLLMLFSQSLSAQTTQQSEDARTVELRQELFNSDIRKHPTPF